MLRSPTRSDRDKSLTGSHPNLTSGSDLNQDSSTSHRVATRNKRKYPNDDTSVKDELFDIKKQLSAMMEMLSVQNVNQKEFMDKVSGDINDIKNEITLIKGISQTLTEKCHLLSSEMTSLKTKTSENEAKIESLEVNIGKLSTPTNLPLESILGELNERQERSRNVIICGISDAQYENKEEKIAADTKEILRITKKIIPQCPEPNYIMRLGKFNPEKRRPVKVSYDSKDLVKELLRNKNAVSSEQIKLFSDKTPKQKEQIKELKIELERRINNGEKDLIIKYVKDVPRIIHAKNYLH
ncbi:unnamed protein product [Leptosia nina]|uniref:Phosphoprotein n=1 Tax=Leptosia nina TaxID=320188 RepID=A0AAV1J7U2_9NEOP